MIHILLKVTKLWAVMRKIQKHIDKREKNPLKEVNITPFILKKSIIKELTWEFSIKIVINNQLKLKMPKDIILSQ